MLKRLVMVSAACVLAHAASQAAIIIDVKESGGNVVATGSGSANLDGLFLFFNDIPGPKGSVLESVITVGPSANVDLYNGTFTGPAVFGTSKTTLFSDSQTGDTIGLQVSVNRLLLPSGYVSGAALNGTATWNGKTFSALGMTKGTYEWTWGSGASADSLTLNIGVAPEPTSLALLGLGAAALALRRRRKA